MKANNNTILDTDIPFPELEPGEVDDEGIESGITVIPLRNHRESFSKHIEQHVEGIVYDVNRPSKSGRVVTGNHGLTQEYFDLIFGGNSVG